MSGKGLAPRPPEDGIVVCMPVYNDWKSALVVLDEIDKIASSLPGPVSVVMIDDGSQEPPPHAQCGPWQKLRRVEIVQLRRNLGHQRAIVVGLAMVHAELPCQLVVVMDADGEDQPADIPKLVARCLDGGGEKIVFAKRGRRSEGPAFRAGYAAYRALHLALTGHKVEVGNFSVIPFPLLERLVGISELWNHYAAAVFHSRLPVDTLPLARGRRAAGSSQMNLISLIVHGMSAISVYCDTVGVRLMCFTAVLIALALAGLLATLAIRFFTALAIPGWATSAAGILSVVLLNLFTLMMVFVLFVLQSRSMTGFLPLRDWRYFVLGHGPLAAAEKQEH